MTFPFSDTLRLLTLTQVVASKKGQVKEKKKKKNLREAGPSVRSFQKKEKDKTGIINDPLGLPTVPAGNDFRLILKFWDGRTDNLCENSDH